MDMYMPGCSGRELSRVIRQIPQFVSLPIVFLSSETDKTVQVSAMRVGADGFLTKPILPEDLVTAVAVRAERTRVLRSLMMRDGLTGLLNHTTLSQFLETALATAHRHDGWLCFAMLDVDHFKKVTYTYGHPAGDQVLVALARLLKQRLRTSDMIGRYGGEEFAAVLQDVSLDEALRIMDQIRRDFAALVFKVGDADSPAPSAAASPVSPATPPPKPWSRPPTRRCTPPRTAAATGSPRRQPAAAEGATMSEATRLTASWPCATTRRAIVDVDEPTIKLVMVPLDDQWFAFHGERSRRCWPTVRCSFCPAARRRWKG